MRRHNGFPDLDRDGRVGQLGVWQAGKALAYVALWMLSMRGFYVLVTHPQLRGHRGYLLTVFDNWRRRRATR